MDQATEVIVQTIVREQFAQSTVISVAHRLHSLRDFDRVLWLDKGRVKMFDGPAKVLSEAQKFNETDVVNN